MVASKAAWRVASTAVKKVANWVVCSVATMAAKTVVLWGNLKAASTVEMLVTLMAVQKVV